MSLPFSLETLSLARALRKQAQEAPPTQKTASVAPMYPFAASFAPPRSPEVQKVASAPSDLPLWAVALYRDEEALEKAALDFGSAVPRAAGALMRAAQNRKGIGRIAEGLREFSRPAAYTRTPGPGGGITHGRREGVTGWLGRRGMDLADAAETHGPGMLRGLGKGIGGLVQAAGAGNFRQPSIMSVVTGPGGKKIRTPIRGASRLHQWLTGAKDTTSKAWDEKPPAWFQPNG